MQWTAIGRTAAVGPARFMSGARLIASGVISVLVAFLNGPADAQNLDAGKTPAQIFADTCSACHRRPQELKRASAGFLRGHYTTGQQEAATMANYLASIPADPRASHQKRQPGAGPAPAETVPSRRQEQKGQPKEQAKSAPTAPSTGRRGGRAEAKAPAPAAAAPPETDPSEPPPAPVPVPAAAAPPPLEPFEE
jgi:hypothetical protein